MRVGCLVFAVVLGGGCSRHSLPSTTHDAWCEADAGVVTLTCDRPTPIDPTAVVDLTSFRARASAAVCDWSLRCGWGAVGADSFCHPSFAALYAERNPGSAPFDLAAARTCVRQLTQVLDCYTASDVADQCLAVNDGVPSSLRAEGAPCEIFDCAFDLACVGGVCAPLGTVGQACINDRGCADGLSCVGGGCARAPWIDPCEAFQCLTGTCVALGCGGVSCGVPRHHVGCACTRDADCPTDVTRCNGGRCTLRPFVGDPCSEDSPPCFGSRCSQGTCVLYALGEGPCVADTDCAPGLVCAGRCGPSLSVGDACGPSVLGDCRSSYCDGARCVPQLPRGSPCTSGAMCASGSCPWWDPHCR